MPFSATSVWNQPLAANAPLASNSSQLVTELQRQVRTYGSWMNTTQYSTPVYRVGADTPRWRVKVDAPVSAVNDLLGVEFQDVPIPVTARAAAGTDGHAVVWNQATDELFEFWRLTNEADGFHADWGGKIKNQSTSNGVLPYPYGATATGLSLAGGLVLPSEIQQGNIPHALALAVPDETALLFTAPANRTDGLALGGGIPAGTRFRLPADLDIRKLGLPWAAALMAQAAQRYGIVVRDRGGAVAFYGEDPASLPGGTNPWPAIFENRIPDQNGMFAKFPWDKLQVVRP